MTENMKIRKPELLAPAGSFNGMRAAVNAGADAVYMGGKKFGARAYAENPDEGGIIKAIEFCHLRNRKLYLTVNTLLKEDELKGELFSYLKPYYEAGLDAVIVQDIGVMEFISENFPGLDIHVSTQASVTMAEGIEGIRGLLSNPKSITRLVPCRELSLDELKLLRKNTELEIEVFIHGALCCCYSGQCLLSSLAGGRSGNRGRCAQPCRRLYEAEYEGRYMKGYFLSPKDMCTLPILDELISCGIDSFKIEGRMKSAEYAAGVVSVYREYIDSILEKNGNTTAKKACIEDKLELLKELYNRGGFNEGYLHEHNGQDMMSTYRPGHFGVLAGNVVKTAGRKAVIALARDIGKGDVLEIRDASGKCVYEFTYGEEYKKNDVLSVITMKDRLPLKGQEVFKTKNAGLLDRLSKDFIEKDVKVPVDIELYAKTGEPLRLAFILERSGKEKIRAEAAGQPVQQALNSENTMESLKELVSKLGNTDFEADFISVEADKGIFVPVGEIKKLKRGCVDKLKKAILTVRDDRLLAKSLACDEIRSGGSTTTKGSLEPKKTIPEYIASLRTFEQLKAVLDTDRAGIIGDIYLDMAGFGEDLEEAVRLVSASGRKSFIKLPRILRSSYYDRVKEACLKFAGFIATNYESISLLKSLGVKYRTDHNLYCFNNVAGNCMAAGYTMPIELNEKELKSLEKTDGELIIYGLLPVMVSAQCAYKTITGRCGAHKDVFLKDEKGFVFRSHSECTYCYSTLYNSAVLSLLHRMREIEGIGPERLMLEFTFEDASETSLVIRMLIGTREGRVAELPSEIMGLKLTNGHFNRGVE